jgi:hypothetical protein
MQDSHPPFDTLEKHLSTRNFTCPTCFEQVNPLDSVAFPSYTRQGKQILFFHNSEDFKDGLSCFEKFLQRIELGVDFDFNDLPIFEKWYRQNCCN